MTAENPKGLEVVQASYGTGSTFTDVTTEVQTLVKNGDLNFTVSAQSLGILDPAPGVTKTFQAKVIINGGLPTILTKNDGEQFTISAPTVKNTKTPTNHAFKMLNVVFYFLVSLCGAYFGYSAYLLGTNGFGSSIVGYILGAFIGGSFIAFSAASIGTGITGLIFATPSIIVMIPAIIFFYSLYSPDGLNLNYPIKNVV